MSFIASNGDDLFEIFYPLIPGATQISADTNFLSGSTDLRYIFRSVVDGNPAAFNTGFVVSGVSAQDLRYVFAVLGSITTPTPTNTPTITPTPTVTFTPTPTVTPTPTFTPSPSAEVWLQTAITPNNIFYTDQVAVSTLVVGGYGFLTPSAVGFEVRQGADNPPSSSYTAFDSVYNPPGVPHSINTTHTPSSGVGYYQYRAWGDFPGNGRKYSADSASTIVFAQAPTTVFKFSSIYALAAPRYDATNGINISFSTETNATLNISVSALENAANFPLLLAGSFLQDFIYETGVKNYSVAVVGGDHTLILDSRSFDVCNVHVEITVQSGGLFTKASSRSLVNPGNGSHLRIGGTTPFALYHARSRNATTGTNTDTGTLTGDGGTYQADLLAGAVADYNIAFLEILPVATSFSAPSLNPTTQTPVDTNGMYSPSQGWIRDGGVNIYDGRIGWSNDVNDFRLLRVDGNQSANPQTEMGAAKGFIVGCWVDLLANGLAGGSSPHSVIFSNFDTYIPRDQAPDHHFFNYDVYSQAGARADCWWSVVYFMRDRNNPNYCWFMNGNRNPMFEGHMGYWEADARAIKLCRYGDTPDDGNSGMAYGPGFNFNSRWVPEFDPENNGEYLPPIYGRIPDNIVFNMQVGGRLKSTPYRNMAIWISQIR